VVVYQLNVRSGPGLFYPVISSLPYGASRSLLGRNSEASWLQINLPDGRPGWVMARYISANVPIYTLPITDGPPPPPVDKPLGVVLVYRLNVRSGPGFGYEILNQLSGGQQVRLQGRNSAGDWLKIEWGGYPAYGPGGTIPVYLGWVSARYLRSFTPIYDLPVVQ
jgi:uncharacterized protein YraI